MSNENNFMGRTACPRCKERGNDSSGDNLVLYADGGQHCFACGYNRSSNEYLERMGYIQQEEEEYILDNFMSEFTKEDHDKFLKISTTEGKGYRGIRSEVYKKYWVRHVYNPDNGELLRQYYPNTENYKFTGYKCRELPKNFSHNYHLGTFGVDCELFGQFLSKNPNSKICVVVEGEIDALSAYQMMLDDARERGKEYEPVVVSPVVGAQSVATQIKNQYDWFMKFDKIILCLDNDDAGQAALERAAKALPKNKVFVMNTTLKDANEYLTQGKQKQWINALFNAHAYAPVGVAGSDQLYEQILENALVPRIMFPSFMKGINEKTKGIPGTGKIINIGAGCVDKDTEYLTPQGWKKISGYDGGVVGQYNPNDNSVEFVQPLEYIAKPLDEKMYSITTSKGVDMVLTENHRFAYWDRWTRNRPDTIKTCTVTELVNRHNTTESGFKESIGTCFHYEGRGIPLSEGELRLQVAVIADGRVVKEGKNNYTQMRFTKERKYARLLELCEEFDLPFKDNGVNNQGHYEVIVWPKRDDKEFSEFYWGVNGFQKRVILEEIMFWDGCENTQSFSTTSKKSADFIQFLWSSSELRATISEDHREDKYKNGFCYSVYAPGNQFVSISGGGSKKKPEFKEFRPEDGMKYCFSVPSTYLVLRRNNKVFITGNSGIGKTSLINEILYYWIFNSPYMMGVVSMELDKAEYGEVILSRHLGRKLALIDSQQQKYDLINSPEVREAANYLFRKPDESPRWYLVDDRGGTVRQLQEKVEKLVIEYDCKVIVLDPLQDLLDGLNNEEQAVFMAWEKKLKQSHGVTFFNINHIRKSGSGQESASAGAWITEEDFAGSSTIFKSADLNILLMRDKYHDDPIIQNTTNCVISKCRWTGFTGVAGQLYYENTTHTLWDKQEWLDKFNADFGND